MDGKKYHTPLNEKGFERDAKEYHSFPKIASMEAPGVPQTAKLVFDGAPTPGKKRAHKDPRPEIKFLPKESRAMCSSTMAIATWPGRSWGVS